jgi:hypothetical protein
MRRRNGSIRGGDEGLVGQGKGAVCDHERERSREMMGHARRMLECHLLLGVALRSLIPLLGLSCVLLCLLGGGLLGGRISFPGLTLRLLAAGVHGVLLARHYAVCGLLGTRSGSSVAFRWSGVAREWLLRYVVMLEEGSGMVPRGSFEGGLLGRLKWVDPVCSVGEARLKMAVDTTGISVVVPLIAFVGLVGLE